jgi:hypothetical protein
MGPLDAAEGVAVVAQHEARHLVEAAVVAVAQVLAVAKPSANLV